MERLEGRFVAGFLGIGPLLCVVVTRDGIPPTRYADEQTIVIGYLLHLQGSFALNGGKLVSRELPSTVGA